mmetsp:Transcript_34982/g.63888  ORF Transcript_34982/g.63888 Transcript_34982/m.63888 type:complete len:211 (-) Transcript_34982:1835-2467(-)
MLSCIVPLHGCPHSVLFTKMERLRVHNPVYLAQSVGFDHSDQSLSLQSWGVHVGQLASVHMPTSVAFALQSAALEAVATAFTAAEVVNMRARFLLFSPCPQVLEQVPHSAQSSHMQNPVAWPHDRSHLAVSSTSAAVHSPPPFSGNFSMARWRCFCPPHLLHAPQSLQSVQVQLTAAGHGVGEVQPCVSRRESLQSSPLPDGNVSTVLER